MADPGFLSGFIGKDIDIAISQILHHAGIALRCKKELNDLRDLVRRIEPMATRIRRYRLELNRNRGRTSIPTSDNNASQWVKKLHGLLRQAMPLVQKCTIPSFNVFARYQMSRDISSLISEIKEHLEVVPLILLEQETEIYLEMRRESAQASAGGSASTSQAPTGTFFIEEALIVGQDQAFATLEKLVIDAEVKTVFRTGVVGKGGSGKTLLLKRLFNGQKVSNLFRNDLFLWLTVSQLPLFQVIEMTSVNK